MVYSAIERLLKQAAVTGLLDREDEVYTRNQIMSLLGLDEFQEGQDAGEEEGRIPDLLEEISKWAAEAGVIEDFQAAKDILSARIMNVFMPKPSEVNRVFYEKYKDKPEAATDYFYELSRASNYIQTKQIAKNITYTADTEYGTLDITINLSKPEKDPKQIAKEREMKPVHASYPKCLLCAENEGYAGRINHPARSNHRMVRVPVEGETWFLQYSPYLYYNEHCILLADEHRDMKISQEGFGRLLAFVEKFPHYFIGSNADIPIVGGSILTHDHYQGGRHDFAMAAAPEEYDFRISGFADVQAATVKWPMSVIRLKGKDRIRLEQAAAKVLGAWLGYSDEKAKILAFSGDTRHNTITPIARVRNGLFEMDLVLRNNRTTEEHPLGLFHPHQDVHHIKKENIGLIEVMGLAVLPARLLPELGEVEKYLLGQPNQLAAYHAEWADELKEKHGNSLTAENVHGIVYRETGRKFLRCLEDAGVFKRDEPGEAAFRRFADSL